jgi:toxin secretion/phage lysis holin
MVNDVLAKLTYVQTAYPLQFILAGLMLIDFFTGFSAAIVTKTLSSSTSWRGVVKKAVTWAVIAMAQLIEPLFGGNIPIANLVILGAIVTEGLSILENAGRLGVLPAFVLRDSLEKLSRQVQGTVVAPASSEVVINVKPIDDAVPGGARRNDPPLNTPLGPTA